MLFQGLRIWSCFPAILKSLNQLNKFIPTWSVNTLAQAYTESALNDIEYVKRTKQVLCEEQHYMYNALDAIAGITVLSRLQLTLFCSISNKRE